MFKSISASLAAIGGVQVLVAALAIGWGLSTLEKVANERQARLDALDAAIAQQEALVREQQAFIDTPTTTTTHEDVTA